MAMHHENHRDNAYKIADLVEVFDEPLAIAWKPGTETPSRARGCAPGPHHRPAPWWSHGWPGPAPLAPHV